MEKACWGKTQASEAQASIKMNFLSTDDYKMKWDDDFHKTRLHPERRTKHRRKPLVKAVGDVWYLHVDKKGVEWHCGKDRYLPTMRV